MRVTSAQSRAAASAKRNGRSGGAGFKIGGAAERASLAGGGIAALATLDALTTLQSVDEAGGLEDGIGGGVTRGANLLDDLARLQADVLAGATDTDTLRGLRRRLGEPRSKGRDPQLDDILDDIELRVAVELAKRATPVADAEPNPPPPEDDLSAPERSFLARRAYGPRG